MQFSQNVETIVMNIKVLLLIRENVAFYPWGPQWATRSPLAKMKVFPLAFLCIYPKTRKNLWHFAKKSRSKACPSEILPLFEIVEFPEKYNGVDSGIT